MIAILAKLKQNMHYMVKEYSGSNPEPETHELVHLLEGPLYKRQQ